MTFFADAASWPGPHHHAGAPQILSFYMGEPILVDTGVCSYDRWEFYDYLHEFKAHNVVYNPDFEIDDCTVTPKILSADTENGTIEISGGTFNANILTEGFVACGIYHPQKGSLKVTGGTFNIKNGCGILMRGGELDMTGSNASFTFTGDAGEETLGKVGDSRVVVPCGKKIVKDAYSGYYDADNIKITVDEAGDIYDVTGNQN